MLPKDYMIEDEKMARRRIITLIVVLFHSISRKTTQPRTRLEFGALMGLE
jgi:hypothetical protein